MIFSSSHMIRLVILWFHDGCVAISVEVYSSRAPFHTLGFPRVSVLSLVQYSFLDLSWLWTNDLINGWRTVVSFLILTYTVFYLTGYNWLYSWSSAGACPQQLLLTLPWNLFTLLGFPECPCSLECNIYSRLVMFIDSWF